MLTVRSLGCFSAIVVVLFGAAFEALGQTETIDCLLWPIYSDGMGNCLFEAVYYEDVTPGDPSTCGTPYDCYLWELCDAPAPQSCPDCENLQGFASADRPFGKQQLVTTLASAEDIKSKWRKGITRDSRGREWTPANGMSVQQVKFANVMSEANVVIPVKLYVIKLDYQAAGYSTTHPARLISIGFEVDKLPDGESPPVVSFKDIKPWSNKRRPTRFGCLVKSPDGGPEKDYTVLTNTPIFSKVQP